MADEQINEYPQDAFMSDLVVRILEDLPDNAEPPVSKEIFGIPLVYSRIENKDGEKIVNWSYKIERAGVWVMEMTNLPAQSQDEWRWIVSQDADACRKDLSLLKLAANPG